MTTDQTDRSSTTGYNHFKNMFHLCNIGSEYTLVYWNLSLFNTLTLNQKVCLNLTLVLFSCWYLLVLWLAWETCRKECKPTNVSFRSAAVLLSLKYSTWSTYDFKKAATSLPLGMTQDFPFLSEYLSKKNWNRMCECVLHTHLRTQNGHLQAHLGIFLRTSESPHTLRLMAFAGKVILSYSSLQKLCFLLF